MDALLLVAGATAIYIAVKRMRAAEKKKESENYYKPKR